eukprot:scaffold28921_cov191-Amphora_coffeaeformis.AAC.4
MVTPWSTSSPKTPAADERKSLLLLPSVTEGVVFYQSTTTLAPPTTTDSIVDDNSRVETNNNNNNNGTTTTFFSGNTDSERDQDSAYASREEDNSVGYSGYSETTTNGDYPDDDDESEEEEEDDDDDEGPPSLTEAFQSIENRPILKLCAWYLTIYLGVAVVAFSYIFEQWTIVDSLYFAVSTFTTCGYGDLEPTTTAGQVFTIFFAIYGVIILGVFIGIVGSFISEHQFNVTLNNQEEYGDQVLETLFAGIEDSSATTTSTANTSGSTNNGKSPGPPPKHRYTYKEAREDFLGDQITLADDIWFVLRSEAKPILLVAIGALILGIREHWTVTSILYFCVMAASTTGYGDYTPHTQADKVYCIFFYPLAVCVFGEVLARIAGVYMLRKQRHAEHKFLHRALTLCDLRKMDADQDGSVTKEEFISYMLVALQKVEQEFIDDLREIFDNLDTTGNGILEKRDLVKLTKKNYRPLQKIREELSQMEEWPFQFTEESQHDAPRGNNPPTDPPVRHRRFNTVA